VKVKLFLVLVVLFCFCTSGCKTTVRYMEDVSQVSYTEESGTIPPELQLYERIVITRNKVTLTRNGKTTDTEVNEGEWVIDVDEQKVGAFFEQLEAIDCSSIKRIEPDALEIGGGTESYRIVYAGDEMFYLGYGGGVTYIDGMLIVEPIEAFIESLDFPAGAANQYRYSLDEPTAVSPTPAPTPAQATTLEITNDSGADICYVYLAPSYSDQWGDDLLGGAVIADGESFTLTGIPFGAYDLKAETSDHVGIDVRYEQTLDGPMTWEIVAGDGRFIPRLDQWAFAATASSERSSPDWSAQQASGAPDTPECGDSPTAWASSAPDGVDWLELGFPLPVVPRRINIYETHSPGFIARVEVIDEADQYHTVWEGEPASADACPRLFSFLVTGIDFPIVGARIHLDQREGGNWNEIDAVELVGLEIQ